MKNEIENKNNENKTNVIAEKKDLEKEINFSWSRVIKQGIRNMKDDVDPVYKGIKMGFYALHGIPTWVRECNDGRLENRANGLAGLATLFVAGTTGLGYYIATKEMTETYGLAGYATLGIPLVATGYSYVKEAFRRAKKKEHVRVIKSRIQKKFETPTEETWDLSYKDMIQQYVTDKERQIEADNSRRNIGKSNNEKIDIESTTMELYQNISLKTEAIINKLYAYNQLGKKYELNKNLEVITPHTYRAEHYHERNELADMVWNVASKNKGSANTEWLGKLTVIYETDEAGCKLEPKYQVEPTKLWK